MSPKFVDTETYAEFRASVGEEFAAELVGTFLQEAPLMLSELKAADASQDPDGFRRAAHSIKSNAEIFGATALADIARHMETSGATTIEALERTLSQTETALRALIDA